MEPLVLPRKIAGAMALVLLVIALIGVTPADAQRRSRAATARQMTVHFIDVDQGAATLLEFPCGAILIDAGGWGNESPRSTVDDTGPVGDHLVSYLDRFFARRHDLGRRLDVVFVTHAHIDHNRYLKRVVRGFTVGGYVHNGTLDARHSGSVNARWMANDHVPSSSPRVAIEDVTLRSIERAEQRPGAPRGLTSNVIDPLRCAGVDPEIRVYAGGRSANPGWSQDDYRDDNNHSLVIRVDYGEASFLFSGDMETAALEALVRQYSGTRVLDVDAWAVGHHGSDNGITDSMVAAMSPELAILSVGPHNRQVDWSAYEHGHPRVVVVTTLERYITKRRTSPKVVMLATGQRRFTRHRLSDAIYATAWDGDVRVIANANGRLTVRTSR